MLLSFVYLAFSALLQLLMGSWRSEFAKRCRTARSAPSAVGASSAAAAAVVSGSRSRLPSGAEPDAPASSSARVDCDAADAAALAPRARTPQVDAAAADRRSAAGRASRSRARLALGAGEPALGLPADRG